MQNVSPMMRQYLNIKENHKDCILFFRLGDFYEMFFDDALLVSRELEITLTSKACGLEEKAPMCGIPYHSATSYIKKLIDNDHKVAICEQLSDPNASKGIVDRDVVRIITKGTIADMNLLDENINSYIASVLISNKKAGIAYADISTGEFYAFSINDYKSTLSDEITRISPNEVIYSDSAVYDIIQSLTSCSKVSKEIFSKQNTVGILQEHFNVDNIDLLNFNGDDIALKSAGALLSYIYDTQKIELKHITSLNQHYSNTNMYIDNSTRSNLEISESLSSRTKKGSLLWVLDKTCTAMGSRQLKSWLEQPLLIQKQIENRLNLVEAFFNNFILMDSIRESLKNVYDLERLLSKISYQTISPRDCLSILKSLREVPEIIDLLASSKQNIFNYILSKLDPMEKLCELIETSIHPDPPMNMSDGRFINIGFNKELDEYRQAISNGKQWLLDLEEKEKQETGIKNLKIGYNKIFGYYFEVTKSYLHLSPLRYIRKQTLANAERFTTQELQDIENKIINATSNSYKLELAIFIEIRSAIETVIGRIQKTSESLKVLDALCSFASVALDNNYIKPEINNGGVIEIINGRHPVVERSLPKNDFVPNDTKMNISNERTLVITGPNMSGKSTYMRQTAIITLMAHIGSFVPASSANISITDRIFTRIGAADNLASGQSTFMVEMTQAANILKNASKNSLIILDEIGRGTSTFDGLSIAWAMVEHITQNIGSKTLFATHYHELSHLEGHLEGVKNYCISVKEYGNDIIFLRKITPGGADKSYGIHVAKLAGVNNDVIKRAQKIQAKLSASDINNDEISKSIIGKSEKEKYFQLDMFHKKYYDLVDDIKKVDVMALTPMQAISELFLISEKANKL